MGHFTERCLILMLSGMGIDLGLPYPPTWFTLQRATWLLAMYQGSKERQAQRNLISIQALTAGAFPWADSGEWEAVSRWLFCEDPALVRRGVGR